MGAYVRVRCLAWRWGGGQCPQQQLGGVVCLAFSKPLMDAKVCAGSDLEELLEARLGYTLQLKLAA
jgi:hypothetical protein